MARRASVKAGSEPLDAKPASFPALDLAVRPPFPPMEARSATVLPKGDGWQYEPKWDGFRCLAFRDDARVVLQSKNGQPLDRYFPEMVSALLQLPAKRFVLDGELVIVQDHKLSFDDLLQRIHPAESRIRRLAAETPATYVVFDVLVDPRGTNLTGRPLVDRRARLEKFFGTLASPSVRMSAATASAAQAQRWLDELGAAGMDGIVAKLANEPYHSGDRDAMFKIKRQRTADCVVGGFRYVQAGTGAIGSLLLGLYGDEGKLDHVGFSASFNAQQRADLKKILEPLAGGQGFTGSAPGGPSRWSQGRSTEWVPIDPTLVCEVRYDHFSGDRFRHGTTFLRWRPDKSARQCTFEQVRPAGSRSALSRIGLA